MADKLVPLAECTHTFGRPLKVLRYWASRGAIPVVRKDGEWFMKQSDLDKYWEFLLGITEELDRRQLHYGRLWDAETMTLILETMQDGVKPHGRKRARI